MEEVSEEEEGRKRVTYISKGEYLSMGVENITKLDETWSALDVSNMGLRGLSPNIGIYNHLTALYLNNNQLITLPPALFDLTSLTHLDLSTNLLKSIPPEIGKLVHLKDLSLCNNYLRELPLEIGRLFRLERLLLDGNRITSLPDEVLQQGTNAIFTFLRDRMPAPASNIQRNWISYLKEGDVPGSETDCRVTVFCYNVLAETYATQDRHPYCPSWALNWNYRKQKVLKEILNCDPDICCLQEVEARRFVEYFEPEMKALGYSGLFRPKSRARTIQDWQKVDGCVIFFKTSKFELIEEFAIEFQSLALARHDKIGSSKQVENSGFERLITKDNVAIACVLQFKPTNDDLNDDERAKLPEKLLVANTHIHWDPSLCDVKLMQTQLLMEELMRIGDKFKDSVGKHRVPMVVCGDFNSVPESGVYELLTKGGVKGDHADFGPYYYGEYTSGGMSHNMGLCSAYAPVSEPGFTNYTADFIGALDYLFYTQGSIRVNAVLQPLDKSHVVTALPNAVFPSDHTSLVAEFEIKSKKEADPPFQHKLFAAKSPNKGNSNSSSSSNNKFGSPSHNSLPRRVSEGSGASRVSGAQANLNMRYSSTSPPPANDDYYNSPQKPPHHRHSHSSSRVTGNAGMHYGGVPGPQMGSNGRISNLGPGRRAGATEQGMASEMEARHHHMHSYRNEYPILKYMPTNRDGGQRK
mmetsp:Transcript_24405/g.61203  ORF Transcript_24405/g.61203 Transcript_24405/m.61203 type:complete len:695 (-) Transcript_24405:149-2233(-)|eukprot:CAMPEP_0177650652 /NCGR_PEP_ID=MMETSP0447-20121125/12066_1 /TAXON_ID=0 /ORGANISM="Stygamoeba regulata, Strain BSH-02190019" /LENGTH=694 /DNA_ID=CAMNT_0019153555 /DNA_START=124 /DNA_END=2208 /DNA_ORIENTATION=+